MTDIDPQNPTEAVGLLAELLAQLAEQSAALTDRLLGLSATAFEVFEIMREEES